MKEINKKNYLILVVLLVVTALLTLSLSNIYLNKEKLTSNFYQYSNKITPSEFDEYMIEHSDVIIYVSNKYDLTNEIFEKKFKSKIEELNLKHNLIYIDQNDIEKDFLKKLKEEYDINIDLDKCPIIITIIDKKVVKNIIVNSDSDIDTLIEYGAFE